MLEKRKKVIIGVTYRLPNTDTTEFNRYMTEILDKIKSENEMFACIGDYNISLMNIESHGPSQEFAEMMYSFSMYPCITKPTRVTTRSASSIDSIFCNNMPGSSLFTGKLYTDISDHFPIFYIDNFLTNTNCLKYFKKMYSVENQEKFARLFSFYSRMIQIGSSLENVLKF